MPPSVVYLVLESNRNPARWRIRRSHSGGGRSLGLGKSGTTTTSLSFLITSSINLAALSVWLGEYLDRAGVSNMRTGASESTDGMEGCLISSWLEPAIGLSVDRAAGAILKGLMASCQVSLRVCIKGSDQVISERHYSAEGISLTVVDLATALAGAQASS